MTAFMNPVCTQTRLSIDQTGLDAYATMQKTLEEMVAAHKQTRMVHAFPANWRVNIRIPRVPVTEGLARLLVHQYVEDLVKALSSDASDPADGIAWADFLQYQTTGRSKYWKFKVLMAIRDRRFVNSHAKLLAQRQLPANTEVAASSVEHPRWETAELLRRSSVGVLVSAVAAVTAEEHCYRKERAVLISIQN